MAGTADGIHTSPLLAEEWGMGAKIISNVLSSLNKETERDEMR